MLEKDVENLLVSLLPLLYLLGWQLYQKMEHGKFGTLMVSYLHCSDLYVANERVIFRGELKHHTKTLFSSFPFPSHYCTFSLFSPFSQQGDLWEQFVQVGRF